MTFKSRIKMNYCPHHNQINMFRVLLKANFMLYFPPRD